MIQEIESEVQCLTALLLGLSVSTVRFEHGRGSCIPYVAKLRDKSIYATSWSETHEIY